MIVVVIIFGSIVACCLHSGLKRYYTEVKPNEGIILKEFLREKKEFENFDESSPLVKNSGDGKVIL